jgi:hypothetical protein
VKQPFTCAVTFETDTGVPITERVSIEASSLRGAVNTGLRAAMTRRKGQRWASVVVLLERGKNRTPAEAA